MRDDDDDRLMMMIEQELGCSTFTEDQISFYCLSYSIRGGKMAEEVRYGDHPDQFIRIFAPQQSTTEVLTKSPVAVVIHGGFWRQKYNVDNALVDGFPSFFGARGWWTVNVEYRRGNAEVDGGAGGWPQTNQDVLLALQALSESAESNSKVYLFNKMLCDVPLMRILLLLQFASMDMSRVVLLGHSAGTTLKTFS